MARQDATTQDNRRPARASRWLWWALDAYALLVLAYLVLWLLGADRLWPVAAFSYIAHLAVPLALLPLPVALLRRRWRSAALQAACLLLFATMVIDFDPPGDPRPPPGSLSVTVMTYNLNAGSVPAGTLVEHLRASGADIVGLQEVTPEIQNAAATELADRYPYQVARGEGIPGKALLSAFPITSAEWLELNPDRPDLRAVVDIAGTPVVVMVVHPPPPRLTATGVGPRPGATAQWDGLIEAFEAADGPLLVLGDLNVTPLHARYREMEALGLQDAFGRAGSGLPFTSPARLPVLESISDALANARILPLLRIDYIWASPEWTPVEAEVGRDAGSDHLPVIARLALDPGADASRWASRTR